MANTRKGVFGTVSLASTTVLVCGSVCCAQRRNRRKGRSQRLCFAGRCTMNMRARSFVCWKSLHKIYTISALLRSRVGVLHHGLSFQCICCWTRDSRKTSVFNLLLLVVQLLRRWIQFQFFFFQLVNFIVSFATGTFVASCDCANCRISAAFVGIIFFLYFYSCSVHRVLFFQCVWPEKNQFSLGYHLSSLKWIILGSI